MKALTTADLALTKELFKVGSSIQKLFNILCDLEINGKKDSSEYQRYLDYLRMVLLEENQLYQDSNLSIERCNAITDFVMESRLPSRVEEEFENISSLKLDNGVAWRIIHFLKKRVLIDCEGIGRVSIESEYERKYLEDLQNALYNKNIIKANLLEDLVNAILLFNEEEILKEENTDVKSCLITIKYFLAYIYKDFGDYIVSKDFNVAKIFDNTDLFAYLTRIGPNDLQETKREYLSKLVITYIYKVLRTDDKRQLLICKSILRALFMLMSDDMLCDADEFFNQLLDENDNLYDEKNIDLIKSV